MGFTSAMLWPIIDQPETTIAGILFLLPFTFSFTRDWLVVSGALDPGSRAYQQVSAWISRLLFGWIPTIIRVAILLLLIVLQTRWYWIWFAADWLRYLSLEFLILSLGLLAMVLGFAGRFAAFILIFPIGFAIADHGLAMDLLVLLLLDLGVLLLGTGAFSIWDPETRIFGRRWGETDA
jgi:hypothetical protein